MRTSAASLAAGRLGVPNPDSKPAKNGTLRRPKRGAEMGTKDFLNSLGGFWYKQRVSKTSVYETPMKVFHKRSFVKHSPLPDSDNGFTPNALFHNPFHNQSFTT